MSNFQKRVGKESIMEYIAFVPGRFDRIGDVDQPTQHKIEQPIPESQYLIALKLGYLTKSRMHDDPVAFKADVLKTIQDAYNVLKTYTGSEIKFKFGIDEKRAIEHGAKLKAVEELAPVLNHIINEHEKFLGSVAAMGEALQAVKYLLETNKE